MFSEILKIVPRVDSAAAAAMEKNLNGRFAKVAKKFGGGIMSVLKGGGVLGLATTLIDKVLNPLQSVQESIDKILQTGGDLQTYSEQFNTSAGSLARLQAFGRAKGLDPEGVRLLLGKFQSSVAQAAADPSKVTSVSSYVGRTDTAEAFFEFIKAMQKLNATQRNLVQSEVFGEKQILKAADFLSADFKELSQLIGGPTAQELSQSIKKIDTYADFRDIATASRELKDINTKAKLLKDSTITGVINGEDTELATDNKRLARYDDLKKISMATDKLVKMLENAYLELSPYLAQAVPLIVNNLQKGVQAVETSRTIRGMIPGAGKDK